ncbi:MAG TPA: peptidoglycan bridge formation glycyltransferase FemA/FemB family protein [Chloroflexia bacterium]|nr:peptidoglycan bridge formation glycyltransferase FemA/FemB family protein [Chloroflexia bacterium]
MSRVSTEKSTEQEQQSRELEDISARSFVARAPLRPAEWDPILEANAGTLLQSWGWGEFKSATGWSPYRLAFHKTGSPRVVKPVGYSHPDSSTPMIYGQTLYRSVPRLPLRVSVGYMPRGPVYLAPARDNEEAEEAFWKRVHTASKKRGAIFLKVEPNIVLTEDLTKGAIDKKMGKMGFRPAGRLQPARTWVLDIAASEDDLLKGMKPKTRYNLRLAGRRGVTVRRAETLADLLAFHSMLETTGARDEFGIHTFPYYEQLWNTFGPGGDNNIAILLAEHPDEAERAHGPIAGLLAFRFGHEAIYMYGASSNRGREHMPNYLLQWEAIRWAKSHECTVYDFWGIPDPPAGGDDEGAEVSPINSRSGLRGVYWFKRGFGGRQIEYPGAYDYVYNPLLYKLWMRWRGSNLG